MKKPAAGIILLVLMAAMVSAQMRDVLYTRDGEEVRGRLLEIDPEAIRFETIRGEIEFDRGEVLNITLGKERVGDTWRTIDDIDDEILLEALNKEVPNDFFAGANYAILYESIRIEFRLDGTIERTRRRIAQVLSEGAKDYVAVNEIYFYPDIEIPEIIHARSVSPLGQVLHLDESAIERGAINPYFPDYDRLNILKYALGEMAVGTIVDVSERTVRKTTSPLEPFFLSVPFYSSAPVLHLEVIILAETGTDPAFAEVNWPEGWNKATVEESPAFTKFTWTAENIPPVFPESNMPPQSLYSPAILVAEGAGWDEIAADFTTAVKDADDSPPRINQIIERSLPGKKSETAKAQALYSWVCEEMGNIPVNAYSYSFSPKKLSQIIAKQSGNNLDRTFLFYSLAKRVGLDVRIGFASTHEDYFAESVPSLFSAPSPLIMAILDGERYFIDLTTDYLPMGAVGKGMAGEPAVFFDGNGFHSVSIAKPQPENEGKSSEMTVLLKANGTIQGQLHEKFYGNSQEDIREFRFASQDQIQQAMGERAAEIHPSAHLDGWRLQNIDDLDAVPELFLEFSAPDFAVTAGEKYLAFKLPGIHYSSWGTGASDRIWPVWFDSPYGEQNRITIELPAGYSLYHLPSAIDVVFDSVGYSANFSQKRKQLVFEDEYRRPGLSIPTGMYSDYRACKSPQAEISDKWLVLEKSK